tara:strand:+ start:97 stop:567 length:471 start_codon:yes stop_codon:yes gene_type:complete
MNQEEIRRMGVDIDAVSLEADRLSRRLAGIAGRCGIKPPEATAMIDRGKDTPAVASDCSLLTAAVERLRVVETYGAEWGTLLQDKDTDPQMIRDCVAVVRAYLRGDAVTAEREACAALMESDVRGARRVNQFCRLAEHKQNLCECAERADAIRART